MATQNELDTKGIISSDQSNPTGVETRVSFLHRFYESGKRLDRSLFHKTGLDRIVAAIKPKIPTGLRKVGARYVPLLATILAIVAYAAALSGPKSVTTGGGSNASDAATLAEEAASTEVSTEAPAEGGGIPVPGTGGVGKRVAGQIVAPVTANVCGNQGILDTGPKVQYPYAVQCLDKFIGDNGGDVFRGVTRGKIRVAFYISNDPQIRATTAAAGGCADADYEGCVEEYVRGFSEWFSRYYETYGRAVELVKFVGEGRENNAIDAAEDAQRIADIKPPVFAVLGGPGEAGPTFAEELKARGIMCYCTVSLPQDFYERNSPWVWSTLMASHQAHLHRAQYIGQRLAGRKAIYAGAPEAAGLEDMRTRTREFGMVWFDNPRGDYKSGVDFFEVQAARYGVKIKEGAKIRYENIEGCQKDSAVIVRQLLDARVTSVFIPLDPICLISLTDAAELQRAKWEWVLSGAVLQDSNTLARLYERNQWSRAFGVSMLSPDVKNENDYWFKMWKEVRPGNPKGYRCGSSTVTYPCEDAQLYPAPLTWLYTATHLAGPKLTPFTIRDGLTKAIPRGGSVTLPHQSYGPKSALGFSFWDYNRFDDMTEIWWDNTAKDANGSDRAYRYVDGGKRWAWGTWPTTDVKPFNPNGTVTGYDKAPDQ